jgi:hypothetical protein
VHRTVRCASDSVRCPGWHACWTWRSCENSALRGYNSLDYSVCTWLSGEPTANGRLHQGANGRLPPGQRRSETVRSHRTVRCAIRLSGAPKVSADLMVDCYRRQRSGDVAGTEQWTVPCPVCTGLSGALVDKKLLLFCPTATILVGAINTTPTTSIQHIQAFHFHTFNTRAKNQFQDTFKASNLLKCHN